MDKTKTGNFSFNYKIGLVAKLLSLLAQWVFSVLLVHIAKCTSYLVSVPHTCLLARHLLTSAATGYPLDTCMYVIYFTLRAFCANRPIAGSGHMVRNKLRWDANNEVGGPLFWSPTALLVSQCNLFDIM